MARGSTPGEALEEFIELFLEDGGELELTSAVLQLSPHNRRLVSNFGALEFVNRFPQLFSTRRGRSKSKVMVKLDIPLEFCPQAGEKGGCGSKSCNRLHLCPFFIKGSCKFGLKCKRSHSYGDEHTIRVLNHIRLGFLNTHSSISLLQKLLKMIVDESEIQRAAAKRSVPDICKFYNKATCKKEDNCPCLHVCEHFIDGDCKFGKGCKREHDFSDPHNRRVLEEYDMAGISELKVLQCLKDRERKHTFSASSDGEKPDKIVPKAPNFNVSHSRAKNDKEKDTEICGFNLRGKCNYGNSCIHRHTELPYLWEYAVSGDNNWESFSSELNAALEHAYCGVKNDSCTVMIMGVLYRVQFNDMTAVAILPSAAVKCKSPSIRRLSTVSSVVAAPGHVFSTRWNWYWLDENSKWQSYDTPDDGHAVNTTSSQCLEKEYMADKDSHCFSASHHQYTLNFKRWYQKNDVHNTKRPVRRRPAEFVTKQNMKDIAAQRCNCYWQHNENNKWQSYDTPDDGHAVNTTSSRCLEKEYMAGDSSASVINDSPWTDTEMLSSFVTSKGGVVTGKSVKLVCPPGAVDNPVSVNITLEDPSKYYGYLIRKDLESDVMFGAPIINLQPSGYFFKKPVKLTTKFEIKDLKCGEVLILHGTEAGDGKITWQDITRNSQINETSQEVTIELEHFSFIVVLLRWTWIRSLDIVSRFNFLAFYYTLSVLLKKSGLPSVHDEIALLFVSQDVYNEEFYHEQESSALVQLTKEQFTPLHVSTIATQEEKRICNNEILRVNIHLEEDYKLSDSEVEDFELADSQNGSTSFTVHSNILWNAGKVIRLRLQGNKEVRRLCGKISVKGENGHTKECHFSEEALGLRGYVRSLLGVEEAIFNVIPIAELLEMPEESMNEVTTCWKDEGEQLDIILKHWSREKNAVEDLLHLRKGLENLKQEDCKVTQRGQMHIRHLREFATKNADSRIFRTLCKSVLRDLCIELECSAEDVERAASSTNHADYFLGHHSVENHRPIPEDIAQKYEQVCSSSEEPCLKTFLDITPYLIQNIKEIFVGYERIVPQNGLRGLSEDKLARFVSNIRNAEQNENFGDLVFEVCQILEQLCLKNLDKQTTAEIKESGDSLEIRQMLNSLTRFFQHSQHDVRLHKRLHLFSRHLREIMTKLLKSRFSSDEVYIYLHDFSNVLLSLIHFAKSDSSQLVRFELTDSQNLPVSCSRENVTYDKHENTYSQRFRINKQSEDELQLHAFANVSIDGRICKKGAFQSVIILNASGEDAFDACMKRFDVAVMKLENKSSGNLRLVFCSTQKEELKEALDALKQELSEDLLDFSESKIAQCHLQMRSIDPPARAVLSFCLKYRWGSEAVTLDSKDFVTFADSSAGGACMPEVRLVGLDEGAAAFPLSSADGKNAFGCFDQLQKHGRLQCEKFEYHLHQTVNQMTGRVCVAGNKTTVNEQMPSQRVLQEGPSSKKSITEGKRC